jgi:hypothetical protein
MLTQSTHYKTSVQMSVPILVNLIKVSGYLLPSKMEKTFVLLQIMMVRFLLMQLSVHLIIPGFWMLKSYKIDIRTKPNLENHIQIKKISS